MIGATFQLDENFRSIVGHTYIVTLIASLAFLFHPGAQEFEKNITSINIDSLTAPYALNTIHPAAGLGWVTLESFQAIQSGEGVDSRSFHGAILSLASYLSSLYFINILAKYYNKKYLPLMLEEMPKSNKEALSSYKQVHDSNPYMFYLALHYLNENITPADMRLIIEAAQLEINQAEFSRYIKDIYEVKESDVNINKLTFPRRLPDFNRYG